MEPLRLRSTLETETRRLPVGHHQAGAALGRLEAVAELVQAADLLVGVQGGRDAAAGKVLGGLALPGSAWRRMVSRRAGPCCSRTPR